MNDLQKLIELRGLTIAEVARRIGCGYHITQKVIKRRAIRRRDGTTYIYRSRRVREGVATILGLSYEETWGRKSRVALRRAISHEIRQRARRHEHALRQRYMDNVPEKQAAGNV